MAPVSVQITGPKTPHSKQMSEQNDVEQNIHVAIRCRPLNEKAGEKRSGLDIDERRSEVRVNDRYNRVFTYDEVFDDKTTQIDIYRSVVMPLISQVLDGYNCTVFAYGQTGTGKTYTMEGDRSDLDCSWEDDPRSGIIPRAVHQLFETLITETNEHQVSVSFMELYNEELYDMLNPSDEMAKLKIYDDATKRGRVIVGGLAEVTVNTKAEIYDILRMGSAKRQTAATKLNACSSRSHTIFTVTVRIKESSMDGEEMIKIGKLNLVDLAGSENIGRSGAIEKRAREAGNINQSLLTLGRVITSLVDKAPHIPYRESKLTRLLQDSLGGGTKTSIIATISPNTRDLEDTLSTLEYAQRAKKITNKPEVNQKLSKKMLLREYTNEIEKLRRELVAARGGSNAFTVDKANYDNMVEKLELQLKDIEEKEGNIRALQEEIERLNELFSGTQAALSEKSAALEETTNKLVETKGILTSTTENLQIVTRDRNEQKHLVEQHVETETKLSEQANQLLNVAQTAADHVERLHGKVDRQSKTAAKNLGTLNSYVVKLVQEDTPRLREIVENSYSDQIEELEMTAQSRHEASLVSLNAIVAQSDNSTQAKEWSDKYQLLEMKMAKSAKLAEEMRTLSIEISELLNELNEPAQMLISIPEKMQHSLKDHIQSSTESHEGLISDMAIKKIHFKGAQKRIATELSAQNAEAENLLKTLIEKDIPTGKTPAKTSFNYPNKLAQTSPHERILARFRI